MNGPLKDYSKTLAEEQKMAAYDDPANGPNPADGNGAPGADVAAVAVDSVADSDSCASDDDDELEDSEAATAPKHVLYKHFQAACLDPAVFELNDSSDTDEESASAVTPAANVDSH